MIKKKYPLYLCTLSILLTTSTVTYANTQKKNNWHNNKLYLRGDIGGFFPSKKFTPRDDDDPYITKKPKNTTIYNLGIGYKISNNIRSDLNFSYMNLKYKASQSIGTGNLQNSQKTKIYSVLLNGYFDINIHKRFKPYLLAGIGYNRNKGKLIQETTVPGVINFTTIYPSKTTNNFIWNVGLGTRFVINKTFDVDLSYKYIDLGKTKVKAQKPNDGSPSSQKIQGHQITGGIIINL